MRAVQTGDLSVGRAREDAERGLTLVELIIVVVIFAILVAIAIPLYLNLQQHARNNAAAAAAANAAAMITAQMAQRPSIAPIDVDTTAITRYVDPPLALQVSGDVGDIGSVCVRIISGGGVDALHLAGGAEEITAGPCSSAR
ncbi:type IV pilin protein [Microbacterium kyungheense]|uniref:Prepilin-type N-terminal cleavage/methylation domain-containing protein n=1 Tax=Microbacterium kyungheense TaxID=1263636 RepID=A0A543FLZ7_9MICO|nr:prepilin-type N-terminal cleavage/methylation domain-containing protein [Microbacterium kyungheense]TQM34889.1 prepilin-type N-terminal cleavage/methylation domain-containing protein [Microbacterium kyungheense]